jgi:MFS family permease
MTVVAKIDLVGPARRGLALGLNEFAGYLAVGAAAFVTAYLASVYGLRPVPFLFMFGAVVVGLLLSVGWVRETLPFARLEATAGGLTTEALPLRRAFAIGSYRDPTLMSCSQAGLVNNLNDGIVWGLVPLLLAAGGADLALIGLLVALYPVTWGLSQLITGAASDRFGRKGLIVGGMLLQSASIALLAFGSGPPAWAAAMVGLGLGTAAVYPTLLSTVGDVAPPAQRAALVGVYRFWRDAGYPVGALVGGLIADAAGVGASLIAIAALTGSSGILFGAVARETLPGKRQT